MIAASHSGSVCARCNAEAYYICPFDKCHAALCKCHYKIYKDEQKTVYVNPPTRNVSQRGFHRRENDSVLDSSSDDESWNETDEDCQVQDNELSEAHYVKT